MGSEDLKPLRLVDDGSLASFLRALRTTREAETFVDRTFVRRARHLTIEDVAQLIDVSPRWYAALEGGAERRPSTKLLRRLAEALKLTEDERATLFARARRVESLRNELLLAFAPLQRAVTDLDRASTADGASEAIERFLRTFVADPLLTFVSSIDDDRWMTLCTSSRPPTPQFMLGPDEGVQCLPLPVGRVVAVPEFATFGPEFDEQHAEKYRVGSWFGVRLQLADAGRFVGVMRSDAGPPTDADAATLGLLARSAIWTFQ